MKIKKCIIENKNLYFIFFLLLITLYQNSFIFAESRDVDWEELKNKSYNTIQEDKENVLANFQYSISLANLGKIEEAYDYFDKIKNRFSIEEFNETINPFIKDLDYNSKNILLLNYAAFTSVINSKNKYSIPYFEQIIRLEPNNIWSRNFLAATYLELEDYDKAIQIAEETNEIQNNEYSHLIIGIAHYNNGNILKALG
ncbi:MAG: tetratricopeptide repeat protein [bacterium]